MNYLTKKPNINDLFKKKICTSFIHFSAIALCFSIELYYLALYIKNKNVISQHDQDKKFIVIKN